MKCGCCLFVALGDCLQLCIALLLSRCIAPQQLKAVYTERDKLNVAKHFDYVRNRTGNPFTVGNFRAESSVDRITDYNGFYCVLMHCVAPLASGYADDVCASMCVEEWKYILTGR